MEKNKTHILCAAIWFKNGFEYTHQPKNVDIGLVVCGRTHQNCFITAFELNGGKIIEGLTESPIQGFLTSDDIFITREKAGVIAFEANQIPETTTCLLTDYLY